MFSILIFHIYIMSNILMSILPNSISNVYFYSKIVCPVLSINDNMTSSMCIAEYGCRYYKEDIKLFVISLTK